jgi:hypothetical protein
MIKAKILEKQWESVYVDCVSMVLYDVSKVCDWW